MRGLLSPISGIAVIAVLALGPDDARGQARCRAPALDEDATAWQRCVASRFAEIDGRIDGLGAQVEALIETFRDETEGEAPVDAQCGEAWANSESHYEPYLSAADELERTAAVELAAAVRIYGQALQELAPRIADYRPAANEPALAFLDDLDLGQVRERFARTLGRGDSLRIALGDFHGSVIRSQNALLSSCTRCTAADWRGPWQSSLGAMTLRISGAFVEGELARGKRRIGGMVAIGGCVINGVLTSADGDEIASYYFRLTPSGDWVGSQARMGQSIDTYGHGGTVTWNGWREEDQDPDTGARVRPREDPDPGDDAEFGDFPSGDPLLTLDGCDFFPDDEGCP